MNAGTNLTIAIIATLATKLHEGRQTLEAGRTAEAVTTLTAIVEQAAVSKEMAWAARWYRAEANRAAGQAAEARADFQWLATREVPPSIRQAARQAFLAAGGEVRDLVPAMSPIDEWQRIQSWISNGQPHRIFDFLTDEFAAQIRAIMELLGLQVPESLGEWLAQEDAVLLEQRADKDAGRAEMIFRQDEMLCTVVWQQVGPEWKIAGLKIRPAQGDEGAAMGPAHLPTEVPVVAPEEITKLVELLGAPDPAVRARARAQLREVDPEVRAALRAFRTHPDPEIAETVRELLEQR